MTDYQCGSCPYASKDRDELRQHALQAHLGLHSNGSTEMPAATAEATASKRGSSKILGRVGAGIGIAGIAAIAYTTGNNKGRQEVAAAQDMAAALLVQLAEAVKEIDFLKSPSETGRRLVALRNR